MAEEDQDEDAGPSRRYEMRLPVQTLDYLAAIKKRGVYGKTIASVIRTFIDAGVREAIDKEYVSLTTSED